MHTIYYDAETVTKLQVQLNQMNPVDLADQFKCLSPEEVALRMVLLDKGLLADTFAALSKTMKAEVIQWLSEDSVLDLIQELKEDELVDTLQELPANLVRKLMERYVDEDRKAKIIQLLGYPEESVGSIMSVNYLSVKDTLLPGQVLDRVRQSSLDAVNLEQIWVTDGQLVLQGFIYLADLLRGGGASLSQLVRPIARTVYASDDQELAAKLVHKYDQAEIPVTDREGRLIGIVPVEYALDVLHDEYVEDLGNIHGLSGLEETYVDSSPLDMAKARTRWLVICLVTASITGLIIQRYETVLATSVALTAYIPMLMDSGGNAGSQASTSIMKALYAKEVNISDLGRVLWKEGQVALVSGLVLVCVNAARMALFDRVDLAILLTVSLTLLLTIMISKLIGASLPLIAHRLHMDPTVMAGPLITTIVDTCALLVYFEVARLLVGL